MRFDSTEVTKPLPKSRFAMRSLSDDGVMVMVTLVVGTSVDVAGEGATDGIDRPQPAAMHASTTKQRREQRRMARRITLGASSAAAWQQR